MARVVFGLEFSNVRTIRENLNVAAANDANFISVPLFHPRFRRDSIGISNNRHGPGKINTTSFHFILFILFPNRNSK